MWLSPVTQTAFARISQLAAQRRVHEAFRWFYLNDGRLLDWQRAMVAVPAPPFGEGPRAEWLAAQFRALGLVDVAVDAVGNVLGRLPDGAGSRARSAQARSLVIVSAHIDTVFPAETQIEPRLEGKRLTAPGACDNAAGVTGLLAAAAALLDGGFAPDCDLLFVGNVGEEGEGDLRGMRYLYGHTCAGRHITGNIVLDGAGTEVAVTEALGSRRFLVTITGPGGHSWTDAGAPNAITILSQAIAELASVDLPASPRTTMNVGTIEGGSSVNAIPETASARFDLRSTSPEQLVRLQAELHRAVEEAVLRASTSTATRTPVRKRAGRPLPVQYKIEPIGERPAGRLPEDSFLLESLRAVDRHLGIRTEPRIASTDANIPLSLGVPAVSIGAGGDGGGIHTRAEWYDATGRELALKRILLLVLAMAGSCDE